MMNTSSLFYLLSLFALVYGAQADAAAEIEKAGEVKIINPVNETCEMKEHLRNLTLSYNGQPVYVDLSHLNFKNVSCPIELARKNVISILNSTNDDLRLVFNDTSSLFHQVKQAIQNITLREDQREFISSICDLVWQDRNTYVRVQLAYVPNKLNLLLLCWDNNAESPVHSHGGHVGFSQCFIRVIKNKITEKVFQIPSNLTDAAPLTLIGEHDVSEDNVSYMSDNIGVHQILTKERAITLHFYIPGYSECYAMKPECSDFTQLHPVRPQVVNKFL